MAIRPLHTYMSIMSPFLLESVVRGYHVWKDIWDVAVGQEFPCKLKDGNRVDRFTVAVARDDTVIGHLRKFSSTCSLYLQRDGSIICHVMGSRQFSADLAREGLEIPCVVTFQGDTNHTAKAKKLVESALATTITALLASKKWKQSNAPPELPSTSDHKDSTSELTSKEWVQLATFHSINFRMARHTKYMKNCTDPKFSAIQYGL